MSAADLDSNGAPGWYFDGRSGAKRPAHVVRKLPGIEFRVEDGPVQLWTSGSWRPMIEPSFRQVRIEKLPYTGEALVVEDSCFAKSLAPEHSINGVIHNRRIIALATLAAVAVAAGVGIWLGYPRIADKLALALPLSLEQRMGGAISASLARDPLEGPGVEDPLHALVRRLAMSRPSPYTWRVMVTNDSAVNAWAAPGGYIGIHRGLVCAMQSPDQLAGVLAHEMAHGVERHSTRNLVRMIGVRLGLALLIGGGDTLLDTATMVGALSYMRADEEEADRDALDWLIRARIEPTALGDAFQLLSEESSDMPGLLQYLSTHPPLARRRAQAVEAANRAKAGTTMEWTPALNPFQWRQLRAACMCASP